MSSRTACGFSSWLRWLIRRRCPTRSLGAGITQQPGKTVSESVAAALEGRVRLLAFDNCEHVLDAAADLIEAILAQSATVRIVSTSREGLRVADEQVWPVPSLDLSGGIDSAAVNLFVERAQSVDPRFSMATADEADAVVEICQRLDGIPLAIELAASRMASMTPVRSGTVSMTDSDCWSAPGAGRNTITHCAIPCSGPMTCSTTRRRRCWSGVRCSQADSTSRAPARWPD